MNSLAKTLAQGLDVRVNTQITAVARAGSGWQAQAESGQLYTSQALLLTPPVPETLALLTAGQVRLARSEQEALARISYAPCLAGLFWIEGEVRLPAPGAVQRLDAAVSWLADNQHKGISPEAAIVTAHASPTSSSQLWSAPDEEVLGLLRAALLPYLGPSAQIIEAQLKRWRYALPTTLHPDRCLAAAGLPRLVFAGDAFGGPRVEGAALSGLAAAAEIS
jgi:predicted NAD/FAD-dependent oxidoreductase